MKKLVSLLLLLTLCICILTTTASAEAGVVYSEGFFYYTVADESITIVGYFGNETEVTIPASIAGVPVNAIAPGAFSGTTVQVINLPDTIMAIGEGGTGNSTVVFPDSAEQTAEPTQNVNTPTENNENTPLMTSGNAVSTARQSETTADEETSTDDEPNTAPIDTTIKEHEGIVIATQDPNATPEPETTPEATEAPEEPAEKSGSAIGWIIGAAVLVCGGVTVVLLRKKGGKA